MDATELRATAAGSQRRATRLGTEPRSLADLMRVGGPVWTDAALAGLLFALTVASRVPYLMTLPYAWDSVLFVRAVGLFNATIHQPQPPGYLFYVSAARAIDAIVHDPNRALVWTSALAAGWAVAALFLLGRLLYDRLVGLLAAGLLLTSVTFWYYGEIAYPYTTLAAASTTLALIATAMRQGMLPGRAGLATAFFAYGLATGFRQDLTLFLAPLFVVVLLGRPPRHWPLALGSAALGVLLWLLPTAILSEGLQKYLDATSRQGGMASEGSSVFVGGLPALRFNTRELAIFLWHGLYLALPPLAYLLPRALLSRSGTDWRRLSWVLLWLAPPLIFYSLAHIGDHGYTLSLLPGLMLLAGLGLVLGTRDVIALAARLSRAARVRLGRPGLALARLTLPLALGALLMAGNGFLFVHHQAQFSATGIACFEQTMQARLDLLRQRFPPDQTLVFSSGYYQHVRYLLPDYGSWFYEPANGPTDQRTIPPGTRYLVIFDELIHPADGQTGFEAIRLPCNQVPFYVTTVVPGDVVHYDNPTLTLRVDRGAGASGSEEISRVDH